MITHWLHTGDTIESDSIFIEQPTPLNLCVLNGKTIFLNWKVQYEPCDWPSIFVKTMNYTLYPNNRFLPIEIEEEFNITATDVCNSGKIHINVTLSIHLNEDVLEHVPYIVCIIDRSTEGSGRDRSEELYLQANRNCFSTTAEERTTHYHGNTTNMQSDNVTSVSCALPCNKSFINVPYYVMCVFIITLLAVLESWIIIVIIIL